MTSSIVGTLREQGFAKVSLAGDVEADLAELESSLRDVGEPIRVFRRHPFWKPIGVDPSRPPGRSGGTGFNSLHIDCVNVEFPPDVIAFYCLRHDPLGGGANLVSVTDGLEDELSPDAAKVLLSHRVSEGAAYDLDHVGGDLNPFNVLSSGPWKWRYTGRFLEDSESHCPAEFLDALLELDRLLLHRAETVFMARGEALLVDQRRVLHGRLPLGRGQDELNPDDRRLIVQAYARWSDE